MEVVAAWDPILGADCAHHRQWVSDLFMALVPHALPGGYPNFLITDDVEQIGSAYGANASQLREIKQRYDPTNLFSFATPIPR
jgi:hypothetical protein